MLWKIAAKRKSTLLNISWWHCRYSQRAKNICKIPVQTQILPLTVVIVPADLHLNKDRTVFARNLFCRETGTCFFSTVTIGQKDPPSAGWRERPPIGCRRWAVIESAVMLHRVLTSRCRVAFRESEKNTTHTVILLLLTWFIYNERPYLKRLSVMFSKHYFIVLLSLTNLQQLVYNLRSFCFAFRRLYEN